MNQRKSIEEFREFKAEMEKRVDNVVKVIELADEMEKCAANGEIPLIMGVSGLDI